MTFKEKFDPERKRKVLELYEEGLKKCSKCEQTKSIFSFYRNPLGYIIPLTSYCKECSKKNTKSKYKKRGLWKS